AGRVSINGKVVKASAEVKVGDVIEIQMGNANVKAEVTAIMDTTKKENASEMYRYI
ncbi:MAG: RNA-binding S4 domain-containing protein, partial [Lachnospiraceae bacterium]|nr:RNA-binding S4 domain-containing protein [Candidatus Equihabitans merdae]